MFKFDRRSKILFAVLVAAFVAMGGLRSDPEPPRAPFSTSATPPATLPTVDPLHRGNEGLTPGADEPLRTFEFAAQPEGIPQCVGLKLDEVRPVEEEGGGLGAIFGLMDAQMTATEEPTIAGLTGEPAFRVVVFENCLIIVPAPAPTIEDGVIPSKLTQF